MLINTDIGEFSALALPLHFSNGVWLHNKKVVQSLLIQHFYDVVMLFDSPVSAFMQGGVIAYPTEAVFGLGCDPDNNEAINKILAIKNRSADKGLILLAANYSQLLPYIDDSKIPQDMRYTVLSRWPDGITQLVPKSVNCPVMLSGKFDTIAVRITSQPDVVALCNAVNKPIVSTSANLSGEPPAKTWQEVEANLAVNVDFIIKGKTLGYDKPSKIIHALTGETVRL